MNALPTNQAILTKIVEDYRHTTRWRPSARVSLIIRPGASEPVRARQDPRGQVNAQAWDRGANAAMRYAREIGGVR